MQEIDDFLNGLLPVYCRVKADSDLLRMSDAKMRGTILVPFIHTQLQLIDGFLKRTCGEIFYRKEYYINAEAPDDLHVVVWCEEIKNNELSIDCLEIMCDMFTLRSSQEGIIMEFIIENAFFSIVDSDSEMTEEE